MFDIIKDIQKLTTIPETTLSRVIEVVKDSICSDALEASNNGQQVCNVDIGIGNLQLLFSDDCIRYKFTPCLSFENKMKETMISGEDPLEKRLENCVVDKFIGAYKEML